MALPVVSIELTRSEYEAVRRALATTYVFYTNRRRLPRVSKWRVAERVVAATEMSTLMDEKFPSVPEGVPWPPYRDGAPWPSKKEGTNG